MIYIGHENVVREVSQGAVGIGGVTRTVYDGWCGVDGVVRRFMGGKITADMIEKVELELFSVDLYTITSSGDVEYIEETPIRSAEDLNAYSQYGTVTVSGQTFTVTGKTKGWFQDLYMIMYITLKGGVRQSLTEDIIDKLDDPRFTVQFYHAVTGTNATGNYWHVFCGVNSEMGSSKSKTVTAAPEDSYCDVGAGISKGSGTETARLTIQDFTIGGVQFMPEIIYNS